jgi:hypothetical protein
VSIYCKNDKIGESEIDPADFNLFYQRILEPSLHRLLDQIKSITQYLLINISHLKDKEFLEAIYDTLSAFDKTVFDSSSQEYNRDYLDSSYEILKILLFLSGPTFDITDD